MLKPKKRSKIRIIIGKLLYSILRKLYWTLNINKFAKRTLHNDNIYSLYPYTYFKHKTPLYRKLKNVDMIYQINKVFNLQIAIQKLDKIVLKPGKIFSFWKLVGKPTIRKGYKLGFGLHNGKLKPEIGGGLCQLSNIIYWITLHTPLTILERHRHSYDVFPDVDRTQPFGSGATVAYPYIDLQIVNNTNIEFILDLSLDDNYLYASWKCNFPPEYKYIIYEKEHYITHEFWGGFIRHNKIYRKVINKQNIIIKNEFINENHAIMMYNPLIEYQNNISLYNSTKIIKQNNKRYVYEK